MRSELLDRMQCPYCGGSFRLIANYDERGGSIISGLVGCPCSRYPILEGILVLNPPVDRRYLVDLLEKGQAEKATCVLMSRRNPQLLRFIVAADRRSQGRLLLTPVARVLMKEAKGRLAKARHDVPFAALMGHTLFENYLMHRFAAETLWMVHAIVPMIRSKDSTVLDLGCGAGHASYVLSSYSGVRDLICTDRSFWELYLARKYMVPNASFIQFDANLPLPFREDMIDCVLALDTLHYVEAKWTMAGHLQRVLRPNGLLLLLHLHNAMHSNPSPGFPLVPSGWLDVFRDFPMKVMPDYRIVEDLVWRDRLDLRRSSPLTELNDARAISIIASNDDSVFRVYDRLRESQFQISRNLRLNPVYKKGRGQDGVAFRAFPADGFATEYPLSAACLPERIPFTPSVEGSADSLSPAAKEVGLELFRRFALVDLPPRYV